MGTAPFFSLSASTSPFPCAQLVGSVPTEPHGFIFQDMGFKVYEYCIWDTKKLCLDPNMLLDVVEVKGPPSRNFFPDLTYSLI
jgi:hypothetical protein